MNPCRTCGAAGYFRGVLCEDCDGEGNYDQHVACGYAFDFGVLSQRRFADVRARWEAIGKLLQESK